MRVAIVEDEVDNAAQMQGFLSRISEEAGIELAVQVYENGVVFSDRFQGQFDIILLDVSMPYIDGFETARRIRQRDEDVAIIFVTNMAQYAIRGYEVNALDYILKPLNYFTFSQRMIRAMSRVKSREEPYLVIHRKNGSQKLKIRSVYYVESKDHGLIYHTAEGEIFLFGNLKDVEEQLTEHHFFRCSKSCLVSLRHVDHVVNSCAVVNGRQILISRARKNCFMQALTDYLGG